MKKILSVFFLLFSVIAFGQVDKVVPNPPNPPRLVNDFAHILTPEQVQALENKLNAYNDSTSNQIAIVTVTGLNGYDAGDYAVALGRKWGVGGKEFNNGVVILVSTGGGEGNRDVFIAPGYGLEGAVPDLTARYIIDHEIIPNFKTGNFYRGLDEATDAIFHAAEGRYKAPPGYGKKKKAKGLGAGIVIFIIIMLIIAGIGGRGGGGGMMSRRGYRDFGTGWLLGSLLGGGGGWSGGSGGGGWSGGGGGFGGFGGGGFGGGGAGGKW